MTTTPKAHHAATFTSPPTAEYITGRSLTVNNGAKGISISVDRKDGGNTVLALDPATAIELAIDLIERAREILKEQS